jgi:hypothetical protein
MTRSSLICHALIARYTAPKQIEFGDALPLTPDWKDKKRRASSSIVEPQILGWRLLSPDKE